jgi:hypothetical protein
MRPLLIDLKTGRESRGRQIIFEQRAPMALRPPLSPDRHYFVDYDLNLWRLQY